LLQCLTGAEVAAIGRQKPVWAIDEWLRQFRGGLEEQVAGPEAAESHGQAPATLW